MNGMQGLVTVSVMGVGLLVACSGNDCCNPPPPPPFGITVSGVVRNPYGEPISNAVVLVPGKSADTTAADGRFSIPDVMPPYDIEVFVRSQNTVEIHKGLTRSDPMLGWWTSAAGPRVRSPCTWPLLPDATCQGSRALSFAHCPAALRCPISPGSRRRSIPSPAR